MLKLGNEDFLSKIKTSVPLKVSLRKCFKKLHVEGKHSQYIYPTKDLHWEYIKNLYNLLIKRQMTQ